MTSDSSWPALLGYMLETLAANGDYKQLWILILRYELVVTKFLRDSRAKSPKF